MVTELFITGLVLTLIVFGLFARIVFSRGAELLSFRAFFLLGFVYFYSNATMLMSMEDPGANPAANYTPSGEGYIILSICMVLFLSLYLAADRVGGKLGGISKYIPAPRINPSAPALFSLIGVSLVIALFAALAGGAAAPGEGIGYTGAVLVQMRSAFVAVAVGLATFYLLSRRYNPVTWVIFFAVLAVGAPITLALGGGRRGFLTMILAIGWAWYYFTLRYGDFKVLVAKAAIPAALAFLLLVTWSTVRHQEAADTATIGVRFRQLSTVVTNPLSGIGYTMNVLVQDAPLNTLFIIEQYPTNYDIPWWHGMVYFVTNPVPRAIYPDKPTGLGVIIEEQMEAAANLGPGIIGHGWAESGYPGVIGYALFFGVLIAIVDRSIALRAMNPFFVVAMGSVLGNVLATPRGDTPLFLANIVAAIIIVMALMYAMNLVFGTVWRGFEPLETPEMKRYRELTEPPDETAEPSEREQVSWDEQAQEDAERAALSARRARPRNPVDATPRGPLPQWE